MFPPHLSECAASIFPRIYNLPFKYSKKAPCPCSWGFYPTEGKWWSLFVSDLSTVSPAPPHCTPPPPQYEDQVNYIHFLYRVKQLNKLNRFMHIIYSLLFTRRHVISDYVVACVQFSSARPHNPPPTHTQINNITVIKHIFLLNMCTQCALQKNKQRDIK